MTTRTAKKKVTKKATSKKKVTKKVAEGRAQRKKVLAKAKKPVGRPSEYDPKFCEVVIEKMAEGYSKEATAGFIGISKHTLYRWAEAHPEFSDAISIGESQSQLHWEECLVKHKVHTKNGKQINGQVFNLNMKNRFGWRDKHDIKTEDETKKPKRSFAFTLDKPPADDDE